MKEICIDIRELNEEQKELVQKAFFKLGYNWSMQGEKVIPLFRVNHLTSLKPGVICAGIGNKRTTTHNFDELMELADMEPEKRKWDKEIRAWLDGAELQCESDGNRVWITPKNLNPISNYELNWRVKQSDEDAAVEKWRKEFHDGMPLSTKCFLEGFRVAKALYVNTTD